MLVSLAWKNIWRNKKRSGIIIAAITFGLWGGLMSGAIMMGMGESMVNTAIDRYISHIQIHDKDYSKNKELKNFLLTEKKKLAVIGETEGVEAVSERTLVEGMAASAASTFGVKIVGINPDVEMKTTNLHTKLVSGSYFAKDYKNQILIGKKLAKRLNLDLRKKIILSFQGFDGDIIYIAFRIAGIFKTESAPFDEINVFVQQDDLFRVLNHRPVFHEIAVRVKSSDQIPGVMAGLNEKFPELSVKSWKELAPELAFTADSMAAFTYLFVAIILFALLFGITNTMLMAVMERVRELGVLMAVGMKRGKIFMMILLETIFLSFTGGIGGIISGVMSISYFSISGIDLSGISDSMGSFGVSTMLYPFLPFVMYVILTVMIVVAANIASIIPAWKAIHLEPSRAIRNY